MWILMLLFSLAYASENVLVQYGEHELHYEHVEQKFWAVPEDVRKLMLANRNKVEQALEGMLYDAVASKKIKGEEIYETEDYKEFLKILAKKMKTKREMHSREEYMDWFKEKDLELAFQLEENKWMAKYWLKKELEKAVDEEKINKLAKEKYLLAGGDISNWSNKKDVFINKVAADVMRRKRLEIWSELVDRSKIKTYPSNFEAFLRKHAPKPSPVEGSPAQEP